MQVMNRSAWKRSPTPCSTRATCSIPTAPSAVKNQQRFNFGVLYPREHCERQSGSDAWEMQTECLVPRQRGDDRSKSRFASCR